MITRGSLAPVQPSLTTEQISEQVLMAPALELKDPTELQPQNARGPSKDPLAVSAHAVPTEKTPLKPASGAVAQTGECATMGSEWHL